MKFDLHTLRPALLVIDMQSTFIAPDGPFRNAAMGPLVARVNDFLMHCRRQSVPIIFCNYVLRADGTDAGLLRGQPFLEHMLENSPTIGVDPRIAREATDLELRRPRPSAFYKSGLEGMLQQQHCNAVILTGVSVNNAISATARDAFARDLPAIVVRDCVAAAPFEPPEQEAAYFQILDTWTAEVADSANLLQRLGTGAVRRAQ